MLGLLRNWRANLHTVSMDRCSFTSRIAPDRKYETTPSCWAPTTPTPGTQAEKCRRCATTITQSTSHDHIGAGGRGAPSYPRVISVSDSPTFLVTRSIVLANGTQGVAPTLISATQMS